MGLYFEIQCTECGYHETLCEGECGYEHLDAMKMKKEFELGEGDPFYRKIFDLFRSTVTEEDSTGNCFLFDKTKPSSVKWEKQITIWRAVYSFDTNYI